MIRPVTITFETTRATDALQKLAQAAIDHPELAKGIGNLTDQLFEGRADYENFQNPDAHNIRIELVPSETFSAFLRAIRTSNDEARRVAPPFEDLR